MPGCMFFPGLLLVAILSAAAQTVPPYVAPAPLAPLPPGQTASPLTLSLLLRERTNATQWFTATPDAELYGHQDSLLRIALQQRIRHIDWQVELGQNAELFLPRDAVSPVTEQGQLGLGGSYYAANGNHPYAGAASLKTGFARYHFKRDANTIQLGRFEFTDGTETTPKNPTLLWLQNNRIAQRLVGNFGFSNGQRSFDGIVAKIGKDNWDLTAMAGRADQGVFNMNTNPELNVDLQYLAFTRYLARQHALVRGFAIGYHDGRTGLMKTDNRALAVRNLDHRNIRVGSYGMDVATAFPVRSATADLLFWGVLQNGQWGSLDQRSGAFAVEGGLRFKQVRSRPWLRGGALRTTGDSNTTDGTHNTFFQVLPTPRNYARFPFFNMMNLTEQFVQLVDSPTPRLTVRTDLHFLQLTSGNDLWYTGGGAFDNKVFGYTGRPGNGRSSFATLYDISADYTVTRQVSFTAYYAVVPGKTVVAAIFPRDRFSQYGYFELNYRLSQALGHAPR